MQTRSFGKKTIVNVIVEVIIVKSHLVKREVFELTAKEE